MQYKILICYAKKTPQTNKKQTPKNTHLPHYLPEKKKKKNQTSEPRNVFYDLHRGGL